MSSRRAAAAAGLFLCFFLAAVAPKARGEETPAGFGNPAAGFTRPLDRRRLPAALQNAELERLSAGALMLLDRDHDLVLPPAASTRTTRAAATKATDAAAAVTLDARVGANLRLGDDPPELPAEFRAQAEPHVARSPVDPAFLVATFQEGRFTNGGAVDCGYSISRDGGQTWTRALIPGLTPASGGPYFRATDPVAAVDLNGTVFLNTQGAADANFVRGVILVSRSTDGGASFSPPTVVYNPGSSGGFPDKPWIAVNTFPGTPTTGRIVVTFTLFMNSTTTGAPIFRSYSDNGGVTWSPVAAVVPLTTQAQGSQPVFLPDGRLAVIYWNFGTTNRVGERLEIVISQDGGVTFGPARRITFVSAYNDPEIRSGTFLPSAATDRAGGRLYVAYQGARKTAIRACFSPGPPMPARPGASRW